jgi:hypothetical protein
MAEHEVVVARVEGVGEVVLELDREAVGERDGAAAAPVLGAPQVPRT